jgi:hypothetical protein
MKKICNLSNYKLKIANSTHHIWNSEARELMQPSTGTDTKKKGWLLISQQLLSTL